MQLTIDSTEPLEHVLRVVGSLYGTELTAAPTEAAVKPSAPTAKPARRRKRTAAPSASRGKSARGRGPATADVRAWAHDQGYEIRDRGRIAGDIVRAYTDAHR